MTALSTHVLDLAAGRPAVGVPVALQARTAGGEWSAIAGALTDADGRVEGLAAAAGAHRLVFDVAAHLGPDAFFPEVCVTIAVPAHGALHVPLLLSPYGYSTYRGS